MLNIFLSLSENFFGSVHFGILLADFIEQLILAEIIDLLLLAMDVGAGCQPLRKVFDSIDRPHDSQRSAHSDNQAKSKHKAEPANHNDPDQRHCLVKGD